MGPQVNALEDVKKDAIRTTIRHFKDDILDNDFQPVTDLDEVQKSLLAEHGETPEAAAKAKRSKAAATADEGEVIDEQ